MTSAVVAANLDVYVRPTVAKWYATQSDLLKAEITAFDLARPVWDGGRVLDMGVGGGRTTETLAPTACTYIGVDYSQAMVEAAQGRYPDQDFRQADARDLSTFAEGSFDFVLFSYNGLDCVGHTDRLKVLSEVHRIVRPGGVFMFSSHNMDWIHRRRILGEMFKIERGDTPVAMLKNLLKPALRLRNYFRAQAWAETTADYLLHPDPGDQFAAPHYNTSIAVVRSQLADAGFTLTQTIDETGTPVAGDHETASSTLYYLATRI